ncbi:excinuclease ABC subunit UvrA [Thiospirochaeta perfilievii]|uniref:UvrABC system protein A n=1 Tax=Thiospirochaeta perfilievii TaxID=252967 RepID=A0A5C1QFL3_9SPIO|nr:excinuclease ABC subunit UvrA [Thiospirochaeta perfilievii]QEN05849.1 excinuclease ABC subunit UvrA [Thiospirochaeta perfilievii]
MKNIIIKGAREHNLKNIDLELPRDKMIVISGKSGSGKSSLAFDTIFAEGQRRYVESLSAYARQFLGKANKPDLDYIEGLSPAISIEQKTTSKNPRSTVGTITEIYDYLRLFFARVGKPMCPKCDIEIYEQSIDQIIEQVKSKPDGEKMLVLAPVVTGRKGEHKKVFEDAKKSGFTRVRVNGEVLLLEDEINLSKQKKHSIEIVVDRLKLSSEVRKRLSESIETALEVSGGNVIINYIDKDLDEFFSEHNSCPNCGFSMEELQPRLFSFNSPFGACPECSGLGRTMDFDPKKIIPDLTLSYNQGAIVTSNPKAAWFSSTFKGLSEHYGFSLDTPFNKLDPKLIDIMLYGTKDKIEILYENKDKTGRFEINKPYEGIIADLRRRYKETGSQGMRDWYEKFMTDEVCTTCKGKRLKPEALSVYVNNRNITDVTSFSVEEAIEFFNNCTLSESQQVIAEQILKEIRNRLSFLQSVGLSYLNLSRKAGTLSGGESQRIRLATQIGASLVGVLYILDEPTIGLHQRDNDRLLATLVHLRDLGNTLIVVEHDEQTIKMADYIVDMGPGAGIHGGNIVAQGNYDQIYKNPNSPTGQFLSGTIKIDIPEFRREGNGKQIIVKGASQNNLKDIDVSFDLGKLNIITGVSGSGKSTLLSQILYPALANSLHRSHHEVGSYKEILGLENVDKVINIDQSPIGRTPRSNPATYVGLFNHIRDLFASLPESKLRGYKPGRFSFNVKGGRCEHCGGGGTKKIEMHFLPDVYVTCDVCKGKRFNTETLNVRYKGKNIYEVLELSIEDACEFFKNIPPIKNKLDTLLSVGLGYINLGQSAITLSGGEAQRVKLALELSKRSTGKTIYIIDEPTTGLHFADVKLLMEVIHSLVDKGNTAILIEHNLDVIKCADKIIDLGPEGGDKGGTLVVMGTPEEVIKCNDSYTGYYLKDVLGH